MSLWVYKYMYNRQDVLVILQSLWVYKYTRQNVLVKLQSLWVYKYNRLDVLVILQSLWVYKYKINFEWTFWSENVLCLTVICSVSIHYMNKCHPNNLLCEVLYHTHPLLIVSSVHYRITVLPGNVLCDCINYCDITGSVSFLYLAIILRCLKITKNREI